MPRVKRVRATSVRKMVATSNLGSCAVGACSPQITQGLKAPAPQGTYDMVSLTGPGLFLSAHVSKQGGTNGITFVSLKIDNKYVISNSFAGARNLGFTTPNPFGIQLLTGINPIENFTIGWPFPLTFRSSLVLTVTVKENNIAQIIANVVHAKTI